MIRNDIMAPAMAGLILGSGLGDIMLDRVLPGSALAFAAAVIYIGWLVRDEIKARRVDSRRHQE
jgi:hypothetical protein